MKGPRIESSECWCEFVAQPVGALVHNERERERVGEGGRERELGREGERERVGEGGREREREREMRTNESFIELGRLPMSNREVGDGGVGGGGGISVHKQS